MPGWESQRVVHGVTPTMKKAVDSSPMPQSSSSKALLIVDVLNDLEFPGGEKVEPWARNMATRLSPVIRAARKAKVPIIYANDNFGRWSDDFHAVYRYATRSGARGASIARHLKPGRGDLFILKPKHSAFYATSLIALLDHLGTRRLILAGIATNLCVLFTAHDAHMRNFKLTVLSDCCAAESDHDHNIALTQLETFCHARIIRGDQLKL